MKTEFDIRPIVQKHSSIPVEQFRMVTHFDDLRLPHIRSGIVFVLARWSGPALVGLKRFTAAVAVSMKSSLELVVIDIDCLPEDAFPVLFGSSGFLVGGNGETLWVKDGVVVAREIAASCSDQAFFDHTEKLQNA